MAPRAIRRFPARPIIPAIICALLACSGCRAAGPYRAFAPEGKEYTCEIPADWEIWEVKGAKLRLKSPDKVEIRHAYMNILPPANCLFDTIESVKEHYEKDLKKMAAEDPELSLEPLETIQVGGFPGVRYSSTRIALRTWSTETKPVAEKCTEVYFTTPDGLYWIEYTAPVAVYEWKYVRGIERRDTKRKTPSGMYKKHLPEFEHLLKTFRRTKKAKAAK